VRVVIVPIPTPSPHERNPCLSTLSFQMSYVQCYIAVTHSSKRPSRGGPCDKVIYRFQRCSGVERSSVSDSAASHAVGCRVSVYICRAASCCFIRVATSITFISSIPAVLPIILKPITAEWNYRSVLLICPYSRGYYRSCRYRVVLCCIDPVELST